MADSKYGRIVAERKALTPDEPLFLLRAQDVFAPATVDGYAALLRAAAAMGGRDSDTLEHMATDAENVAAGMRVWQAENAERVKLPD